ncbi:MAG: hypothetical protein K2I48_00620 [Muribaculaceae bacterium]|nr:hypothetical protein [Muribaculaceae bacterium]
MISDWDDAKPVDVYNLSGIYVGRSVDTLTPGIYIMRHGNLTRKIAVK